MPVLRGHRPAPTTLDEAQRASSPPWAPARGDHDQGDRRRRRARHAGRATTPTSSTRPTSAAGPRRSAAFGNGDVYAERLIPRARHVEVQIVGDGTGAVVPPLGARVQHPAPPPEARRDRAEPGLDDGAARSASSTPRVRIAARRELRQPRHVRVPGRRRRDQRRRFAFIEANPRLQVEHTVTEEVLGLDLVAAAARARRRRARWPTSGSRRPRARAARLSRSSCRVNMETMDADGAATPGRRHAHARSSLPSGPGVRVDTFGYAGYRPAPRFDSLLAKVIVHSPSPRLRGRRGARPTRALREFRIEGVADQHPRSCRRPARIPTSSPAASHALRRGARAELVAGDAASQRRSRRRPRRGAAAPTTQPAGAASTPAIRSRCWPREARGAPRAGRGRLALTGPEGTVAVPAPMQGTIVSVDVGEGDPVRAGQQLAGHGSR